MNGTRMSYKSMAACLLASWVASVLLRDPAPAFVYDASQYWGGAQAIVRGADEFTLGGLATRGVFTSVVYLPAFVLAHVAGGSAAAAGWAVLLQNGFMVALLGAVIIPLMLRRAATIGPLHVGVSTLLTSLVLSRFLPYPLMDLPAAVCIALAVLLLCETRWWTSLLGGAFLALAVNLRPAYAVPAVLVILVVVAARWRRGPVAVIGAVPVVLAQVLYGRANAGVTSLWPPGTETVTAIQLNYAAYVVRYDTVPFTAEDPRLWHCSPGMATTVGDRLPASTGELFGLLVRTLPDSALFAVEKVTASLHWSSATPYAHPGEQALRPLGLLVILATCAGVVSLVALLRSRPADRTAPLALLALVLGVTVTLVGATPEARFSLPLVVAGLAGVVAAMARWWRQGTAWARPTLIGVACAAALSGVVAVSGWQALQHDAPRGELTAQVCRDS